MRPHSADEVVHPLGVRLEVKGSLLGGGVSNPGAVPIFRLRDFNHIMAAAPIECQRLSCEAYKNLKYVLKKLILLILLTYDYSW